MGNAERIPSQYLHLYSNEVLVLLDSMSGRVVDVSATRIGHSEPLDDIRLSLAPPLPVYALFDIPKDKPLDEHSVSLEDPASFPFAFPSRIGVFDFKDTPSEFHANLPLARIRLFTLSKGRVLGIVRLSTFFASLSAFPQNLPLFLVDSRERLAGFNGLFLSCFNGRPGGPASFLGKPLSEFLAPTPSEIQKRQGRDWAPLPEAEWKRLRCFEAGEGAGVWKEHLIRGNLSVETGIVSWKADNEVPSLLVLPDEIKPDKQELRVSMVLSPGSALPGIIVGEAGTWKTNYNPDLDGYFLGPDANGSNLVLKKRGNPVNAVPFRHNPAKAAKYEYIKSGISFSVLCDGRPVFAFHDFEGLPKEAARLFLYLRNGSHAALTRVELSAHARPFPQATLNRFTTLKNRRSQQCHIERLIHSPGSGADSPYTAYQLRDMTDVRKVIEDLEQNYKSALEREKEAVHLLREQQGIGMDFVGEAKSILSVKTLAERAAGSSTTILIQGETGTGKEMMARFIHGKSSRANGPFIQVDCSTLPPSLIESILFGHEKGAFTGSSGANPGLFRQADGGTLFLDEIHNLPMDVQAKLLRFLQDQTLVPLGGQKAIKLDLRILVATNLDLKRLVRQGQFREDLYYRIAVIVLQLPPLRDRMEDIPALAHHFLDGLNRKYGKNVSALSPTAFRRLVEYDWPGNIRELKNVVERAHVLCDGPEIGEELIALAGASPEGNERKSTAGPRKPLCSIRATTEEVVALLAKHKGTIRSVTETLGVTRQTLYVFCRKNGIIPADYRRPPEQPVR